MKYIKISGQQAKESNWNYNPNGATENEQWLDGDKVRCQVYPLAELDKTVVLARIEAGAFHGRTVAKSDYYYTVLLGRGEFFFYDGEQIAETVLVQKGDVLMIPAEVDYNYQAQHQDLEVHLLMNNLWDVDNE